MRKYSLTYIYHDCFLLETEKAIVIFDYWKDPLAKENKDFPPLLEILDAQKRIYILVSHHHKDHFSRRIFFWQQRFPDMKYIISRDVAKSVRYMLKEDSVYSGFRPSEGSVSILSPGEVYIDDVITIRAYGSTDIGNSYAVEVDGYIYFHAGDLNAWSWIDESTPEEVKGARNSFTSIVAEIKHRYKRFDLVMFPVDSRQGSEYWWGAKYFIDEIASELFVPMHFELVLEEEEKIPRRTDAAAFKLYASSNCRQYVQLAASRASYLRQDL